MVSSCCAAEVVPGEGEGELVVPGAAPGAGVVGAAATASQQYERSAVGTHNLPGQVGAGSPGNATLSV